MTIQPDIDIAGHLSSTLPQLTTGENLFVGPMRPYARSSDGGGMARNAVFCLQIFGKAPLTFKNSAPDAYQLHDLRYPNVQVSIRRDQYKFEDGRDISFAIVNALNRNNPDSSYVDSQVNDGSPHYLGQDKDGDHLWSINVELTYEFFARLVYFGVGPAGSSGAAFIESLATNEYSTFRYRTLSLTTGVADKMYYAFPTEFSDIGTVAFDVPFSLASTDTIGGVSYNLYESVSAGLGLVTVNVT
tara:strand:+ start:135 stop:866 length:732 start_codon:yes stop_codon:yes gene_type:complete